MAALVRDGKRPFRQSEHAMASIRATHLLRALEQSGFVLFRRPPTQNNTALSGQRGFSTPGVMVVTTMPEQREPFYPVLRPSPPRPVVDERSGFTSTNTSGLNGVAIAALNVALARLIDAGLSEHEGKVAIDATFRTWLDDPVDIADAELERLLAWR